MAKKLNTQGLEETRNKLKAVAQAKRWIKVGMSTCGIAAGADQIYATFIEEAKKRNLDVQIKKCGCNGMCYAEPLVEVHVEGLPDVVYGRVDKEGAVKILEKHITNGTLVKDHIYQLQTKR